MIGESPECHGTARGTYCEVGLSDVLTGRFMDCEILKPHWQPSHSALSDRLDDIKTENRYMHLDHSSKVDAMAKGLAGLEVRLKISSSHDDGGYPMITPTDETGVIAMKIPEELAARLRDLMSLESDAAREQVLVSLNFHARPVRHASISDAYSNTSTGYSSRSLPSGCKGPADCFGYRERPGRESRPRTNCYTGPCATSCRLARWPTTWSRSSAARSTPACR